MDDWNLLQRVCPDSPLKPRFTRQTGTDIETDISFLVVR